MNLRELAHVWRRDRWLAVTFAVVAVTLGLFVLYPLVVAALTPQGSDWLRAATTERWRVTMANTLQMAALSTVSSVVVGFVYAYAITKAKIPGSGFFKVVPLLPLITPPFVSGLAVGVCR